MPTIILKQFWPGCQCPNLIRRFMKLMLQRLSADWQQRWGHPIALVESFVDPKLYQGTAYKISSRSLSELQARGVLWLKRKYWVIESRLHHCLDITLQEDLSRVRSPNSVRILGMIRRLIVSLSNAAVDRARKTNPKTKHNTKSFRKPLLSARGGRERLQAMIFAKHPQLLDL